MTDSGTPDRIVLSAAHLALFPLPVVICDPATLQVLEANDLAAELFGYAQRADCLALKVSQAVADEDLPLLHDHVAGFAERQWSAAEWRMQRRDGARFDSRSYSHAIHWNAVPARLVVIEDVSAHKQRERALLESEQQYRATMGASQVGVFVLQEARFRYANPALCDWFGYTADELVDRLGPLDLVTPEQHDFLRDQMRRRAAGEPGRPYELIGLRRDGSRFPIVILGAPSTWRNAPASVGTVLDVSEIKRAEAKIRELAYYDSLTGLANRSLLEDRVTQALARAARDGERAALLCLDLDRFMNVNDSLGHLLGDSLLRAVAQRLRKHVRQADTVARPGGDEFIVLATGSDAAAARTVAEKLLHAFAQPFIVDGREVVITPSIGVAVYPDDGADFAALLRCADIAMYQVKHNGRNAFRFYAAEMNAPIVESHRLETRLRRAVDNGELSLVYQPLVRVGDGHIVAAEALLRWHHPELGEVSPGRFIPIAEESGLIVPIGDWVLEQAAAQARAWHDLGHRELSIAVNFSAIQFQRRDIGEMLFGVLDRFGLPGSALEVELTESVLMEDAERAVHALRRLSERGVRMSVDDFGTGYSSLAYLTRLPITKLKIDRSFISGITTDANARNVARAIVGLGHSLGLAVVAEGVEQAEQLALLREWSCDEAQGFHLGRPLTPDAFVDLLRPLSRSA